jgi:DNA transposition AAA+ family ATPase
MSSLPSDFVVTSEHRRFAEFCDACRRHRYIGLCYGAPGVGKTLSAVHYTNSARLETAAASRLGAEAEWAVGAVPTTVFYTPEVVNSPRRIEQDLRTKRHQLRLLAVEIWLEDQRAQHQARKQAEALLPPKRVESATRQNGKVIQIYESAALPRPPFGATYAQQRETMPDPTDLIIIDEADRLKTAGLEQMRDIFDHGDLGMVLIGMPGLEKRLSRYPQFYSRVGFVHAFRPLRAAQVRELLQRQWLPSGITLPQAGMTDETTLAAIIRVTGGNFRLLHRLLTQIARIVEINALQAVTSEVVEVARESLVIGTSS